MALDVLPAFTLSDVADSGLTDSELFGQLTLFEVVAGSDGKNVGLCEDSVRGPFSCGRSSSFGHLRHIGSMIPKTEMSWLDTDRAIIGVQDIKATGWSFEDAIRGDMGLYGCTGSHTELPVSQAGRSGPIPAPFCRRIARHKPGEGLGLGEALRSMWASARKRIAMSPPSFVVGSTPSFSMGGAFALGDRTFHIGSTSR